MTQLAGIGVLCHMFQPTVDDCARLAAAAEEAGAEWCLLPDALGWRDAWVCLHAAARATSRILLGPGVTNPYTRHPFVTLAALATLAEVSGGRAFLGVAAGGSELSAYAGIDRGDASERLRELVQAVRRAAAGDPPLPMASPVPDMPVLGGARSRRVLEAVADCCDVTLLWGQTHSDLEKSAQLVAFRAAVAWSPLRLSDGERLRAALVYGILNSRVRTRRALGVSAELESGLRERVLRDGMEEAAALVPEKALEAFAISDDVEAARLMARRLGAESVVVQAYDVEGVAERVAWAREVAEGAHFQEERNVDLRGPAC